MIRITDTITLDDHAISERFIRARGAGAQNSTHDATAVELTLDIAEASLPLDVKARLLELAGRKVTTAGVLVIASRAFHSQVQNREAARAQLLALLQEAATEPKPRKATRPRSIERTKRKGLKQRHSAVKRARSGQDD